MPNKQYNYKCDEYCKNYDANLTDNCSVRRHATTPGEFVRSCYNFKLKSKPETESNGTIRTFSLGATRDNDINKLDYEGFNSPLVDKCYAAYLNKHRIQSNGNLRDSDNWQKLFGDDHFSVCMKSLCRHVVDARLAHRGHASEQPIIDSLCGIIFNANAYLLKLMLEEEEQNAAIDHETGGQNE